MKVVKYFSKPISTLCYYWWKLICECGGSAWHAGSLSVSVYTHINAHDLRGRGPTKLPYAGLISVIVVKAMSSHWTQYDCEHAFANYFAAIIASRFELRVTCRNADCQCAPCQQQISHFFFFCWRSLMFFFLCYGIIFLSQEEIWGCHMSMGCKTLRNLCDQDKNSAVISSENFKSAYLENFT